MSKDETSLSFWIKAKSVATLANRNICDKTQNPQVSSPTVSQNWRLCWGNFIKVGVTLGLDHIYLLTLFDLYALHYDSLFGFEILYPDLGYIIGK